MSDRQAIEGLKIAPELADFIENQALPGTGVEPRAFWAGLSRMIHELGPENRALLETREAIHRLGDRIDTDSALALWESAVVAPWQGAPVWVHGDVSASNLLVDRGCLHAVLDFGCSGVGDPACDLTIAWTLFSGESRKAFFSPLAVDGDARSRARGWALWKALIVLAEHIDTNPSKASEARGTLGEVLADEE